MSAFVDRSATVTNYAIVSLGAVLVCSGNITIRIRRNPIGERSAPKAPLGRLFGVRDDPAAGRFARAACLDETGPIVLTAHDSCSTHISPSPALTVSGTPIADVGVLIGFRFRIAKEPGMRSLADEKEFELVTGRH